jgi:glutathione S-transferase
MQHASIAMADPVLYSFRRCPYAMRARLALAISRVSCELREVKLAAKPAEMLAASPKGTVPVLVLTDHTVIDESLDIMRWALARHDPENWLERGDKALIAMNDGPFKHDLDRFKYPGRYSTDPLVHRSNGAAFLQELEGRLSLSSHLSGPARGITDAAIMPFVRQFAATDRMWFDSQPLPNLKVWLASYLESNLFKTVMIRVPAWSAGDPRLAFPCAQTD